MLYRRIASVVGVAIALCLVAGCSSESDSSTSEATATSTVTVTADSTIPALSEGSFPGNGTFKVCDDHSAIATEFTSCPFAINVGRIYRANPSSVIYAYSPVTGKTYDMQCQPGFSATLKSGQKIEAVRCVGGNNAVAVIY